MSDDAPSFFEELLAEAVHEPPLLIPGTMLASGRFVIRTLLGTGGMGAVYKAIDTRRNRDVAVKVLSRVEAAGIYRLKQEFRSLSSVRHPNLVSLHELHSDGETWFFTMDLVAGKPVSRLRWTSPVLRDVFGQIAEALHAIHRQGKLHRDLKPSNVMITPAGRVVVLDFGLVSDQEIGGTGQTLADDGIAGTPTYMAPEQADGIATTESDWYAFGTMLYEALFGTPPFEESGVAALVRKHEKPAPRPTVTSGDVPEDLVDLCLRLLDRDAAKRPDYPEIVSLLGAVETVAEPSDGPVQDPFVGRESELHALEQALLETDRGCSAIITVSGGPGIGKTRLVKRFLELARADLDGVVLSGQCRKWEHVPFRACDSLIDDLSRHLRTLPTERAASVLPRNAHALTQLFPVLARLPSVRAVKQRRALPREPSELRRLGVVALRELMGNIAAQDRLVVFVDDMQWSDLDGARLLASLVTQSGEPDTPAMLLVIAHREQDEVEAPGLASFFERLAAEPGLYVRHLPLRELSAAESRQLVARLLEDTRGGFEDQLALEAGGNPFFIRQLVHNLLESSVNEGLFDLEGLIESRIARLAPLERGTLAAICLTSRPVPLDLLAWITDQPDPEASVRNLASVQLARFVSGPTERVAVFHSRIRDVVLSVTDPGERARLHARAVEALEREAEPDLVALTLHYLGCGREREAAATAVKAADRAGAVLAFEQAAAMYQLALDRGDWEVPERIDLLVQLAESLALDHRSGEAGARFLEAAALETDADERWALRLRAADQYMAVGWLAEGIDLLRKIFDEVGLDYEAINRSNLVELRHRLAQRGLDVASPPESELPPETIARLEALRVAGGGLAWIKPESVSFRFVLALEALDAGEPMQAACGLRTVARFDAQLDPNNDQVYRVVRRICEEHPGSRADLIRPGLETGMAFVRGRSWDQYEAARRTEEELLQHPTQDARTLAVARFHQALALFNLGEVHEMRLRCWGWLRDAEDRNDLFLGSWLNVFLAGERVAVGRPDVAREMCETARQMWAALGDDEGFNLSLTCSDVLSACDVYDGDGLAYERLRKATRWLDSSPLGRIPFFSCHHDCVLARTAIACAQRERTGRLGREELLHEAEISIAKAAQPSDLDGRPIVLPHYRNLSTLLSAGLAAMRDDTETALALLDRGLEQMSAVGSYTLRSAYARRAKGVLLGGSDGNALVAQAETNLRRLGIRAPARHARTVLPGFPR